ncbi:MAG: hypothetical protein Q4D21_06825 [Phascolarctobacterium sp.]|nr:hypothetical protein [Phascolarctobacterium sp.]
MNFRKTLSTALLIGSLAVAGTAFAGISDVAWQNVDNKDAKVSLIVPAPWTVSVGGENIFTAANGDVNMAMTKSEKKISTESLNRVMSSTRERLLAEVKADYMKKHPRARLMQCGFVEHPLRSEIRIIATVPEVEKDRHYQMTSMFLVNHHWYKVESNYPMNDDSIFNVQCIQKAIKSLSFE